MFVAYRTVHGDSHQYIAEAIRNGATGVLCTRPPDCDTEGVSVIMVRRPVDALLAWAHLVLGRMGTKVIAVTGSSGKSTTAAMIANVLSSKYRVHYQPVMVDGPISVPLALATLTPEDEFCVLQLGVVRPGEMAAMVQAVQPEVGVITRVDYAHIDNFETIETIAQEKSLLIEYLSPQGLALLNYDDDLVRELGSQARANVETVSVERFGADWMAFNVIEGLNGTGFDLRHGDDRYKGRWIPLLGRHQLYPALMAMAVGHYYDVDVNDALLTLKQISPLPGRMKPFVGIDNCLVVDDSYSANPQSTLAALDWLAAVKTDKLRTIFVMGDMEGLGHYSQYGHRTVGHRAADVADYIITKGMDAAAIGRAALDKGYDPAHIRMLHSAEDVVTTLRQLNLNEHDIVLVKGGASARMEYVVDQLLQTEDDRELLVRHVVGKTINKRYEPSWIEIDTSALAQNTRLIKSHVGEDVALMAIVKADGYGHGAVTAAQTALLNGASYLGVATLSEALSLREAGITAPILVMTYVPSGSVRQVIRYNLTASLYDLEQGHEFDRAAREFGEPVQVHVKIDTGMGRLGVLADDVVPFFRHLKSLQFINIEGIFTHFSVADEDIDYTRQQVEKFKSQVLFPLRAAGMRFKYVHAANSAGIFGDSENWFNMVRAGIALYGLRPAQHILLPEGMKPALSWKTTVVQVKDLPPNHPVGYGNTYITRGRERIAIIPVGYADGLRRSPQTWREVLIHGQRAPLVGRVSMEKCAINVSHIPDVSIGDEVVLIGAQGNDEITADEVAEWLGTINYEVVTTIAPRLPRH